jgi:long-chain acyl-CoA synthetase
MDLMQPIFRQIRAIVVLEAGHEPFSLPLGATRVLSLAELQEMGRRYGEANGAEFDKSAEALRPQDDLTIIYTSGTTGEPKGVLTTHGHYLFMVEAAASVLPSTDEQVNLQFLPFAHSFGRLEHFMVIASGYTCGFARSMETVSRDLAVVRPTILFSVPRVYENAHDRIRSRVAAASAPRRLLFRWGISVGKRFNRYQSEGKRVPWSLSLTHSVADALVFSKIRQGFGGRLQLAISGGAPLAPEIAEFFCALGVLVLEGYGLTESSTVSHVNRLEKYKFGTVGPPLPGMECRTAADGEVLLRGPNIFKGYYRDSAATLEVLDDEGWFHTGDMGEIDSEGFLRITERKKDLIVTSGGKKVAPQMIENFLKTDPWISQAMVLGDGSKHLLALITLNQERIKEWGKGEALQFRTAEEMISHPRVLSSIKDRILQKNKELAPFEAVRSFRILAHDFTIEGEELTPTLKLKRQVVRERYSDLIEDMVRKRRFDL